MERIIADIRSGKFAPDATRSGRRHEGEPQSENEASELGKGSGSTDESDGESEASSVCDDQWAPRAEAVVEALVTTDDPQ